jgi:peptide-methionine (R)-S-oxide reductase
MTFQAGCSASAARQIVGVGGRPVTAKSAVVFRVAGDYINRIDTPAEVSMRADRAEGESFPVQYSDAEWRQRLTPEQYRVLRQHGTEAPGSCALLQEKRPGTFVCAGCDQPLFRADTKFESGTGWPSFFNPVAEAIGSTQDMSYGMVRTEVHCSRCGGHLGHVFPDGPPPSGLRYCINGVAINFRPAEGKPSS